MPGSEALRLFHTIIDLSKPMNNQHRSKACPYCAEAIHVDAIKCRHCGEILDNALRAARLRPTTQIISPEQKLRKWSPGIAALLSFLIPGAGQLYKGNIVSGLLWFAFVGIGYFLIILPGILLHIVCIFAATSGDPNK
jgi:predicted nucleic acid-binding Zn ribbon protein